MFMTLNITMINLNNLIKMLNNLKMMMKKNNNSKNNINKLNLNN